MQRNAEKDKVKRTIENLCITSAKEEYAENGISTWFHIEILLSINKGSMLERTIIFIASYGQIWVGSKRSVFV